MKNVLAAIIFFCCGNLFAQQPKNYTYTTEYTTTYNLPAICATCGFKDNNASTADENIYPGYCRNNHDRLNIGNNYP